MEIEKIKEIVQLMKDSDLKVFQLEDDDVELYLEAHSQESAVQVPANGQAAVQNSSNGDEGSGSNGEDNLVEIRSDQIGVFYTQPDEESTDTFVKEGDSVQEGDQIGLIETMKLFNKMTVSQAGTIEKILVANGETVEYDQALMLLRPEGE